MSVNDHQLNLDWNQVQLMLWFVLHLVLLNFELTKSTFEWEQFFFSKSKAYSDSTSWTFNYRWTINDQIIFFICFINDFSSFYWTTIFTVFIIIIMIVKTFLQKKHFLSYKISKNIFYTLVLEFSSVVITVKTGIFLSLSDKQRDKGFSRRCRFRSEMIWSFSLLSSFGVTVERVLSNNLINWSEWES